ncbi:hypothetical protein [Chenggangzhangella methanolivorans]|uniref:Uncharacterized protein n=1 Tax=Chenggangzhangella methanolivorans TaxID=1437009 RepID=A0A9E6UPI8_9HYPH|nr:hypothetical protein [Chenggangzhangella methanolivorans]QZO01459.1 hypothetical protein K6K41_08480 [Chenggangzhangella methanolivorans]
MNSIVDLRSFVGDPVRAVWPDSLAARSAATLRGENPQAAGVSQNL